MPLFLGGDCYIKRKNKRITMWAKITAIMAILVGSLVIIGCDRFCKDYPDDNIIENLLEDIIKSETGLEIDLTPESIEDENRWSKK